jgi:hypothetical protein
VLAVPRSIAISCEAKRNNLPNTIYLIHPIPVWRESI